MIPRLKIPAIRYCHPPIESDAEKVELTMSSWSSALYSSMAFLTFLALSATVKPSSASSVASGGPESSALFFPFLSRLRFFLLGASPSKSAS